jgi:hypothetical protein
VAPVTIPFVYGGEREITVYPPKPKIDGKLYRPKRMLHDTTKDEHDFPIVDIAADLAGHEDKQTVKVKLDETNAGARYDVDADAFRAGARARANTLRVRAREFQLSALPTAAGRDPGPLEAAESRPESRPADPSRQ